MLVLKIYRIKLFLWHKNIFNNSYRYFVKLSLFPFTKKIHWTKLICAGNQRAFRNTRYICESLYECECRCLENWDILFYRESSECGGLFYEVTAKERWLGKWLLWAASIYFTPVRSFASKTSKLLLKLLTIRRSQIKIRAFFVGIEIRTSSGIVRIYCQLNATVSQKKRNARIAPPTAPPESERLCESKYHKHVQQ